MSCHTLSQSAYEIVLAHLARLRRGGLVEAELKVISRNPEPSVVHALLEYLENCFQEASDPKERLALAEYLPESVQGLATATELLMASSYLLLPVSYPLPEDIWKSEFRPVNVAWLKVSLIRDASCSDQGLLFEAVQDLDWSVVQQPIVLLERLMGSCERKTLLLAAVQIQNGLTEGWLRPKQAKAMLEVLLGSEFPSVAKGALDACQHQVLQITESLPMGVVESLESSTEIALAAIQVLAVWSEHQAIVGCLRSDGRRAIRKLCLIELGRFAKYDDQFLLLELAEEDFDYFGAATLHCFSQMCQRGVILGVDSVRRLFALVKDGRDLETVVLATVLRGRWSVWLECLRELSAQHWSWPMQLEVLSHSRNNDVDSFLLTLLTGRGCEDALGDLITLVGRRGLTEAETVVWEMADEYPDQVVQALYRIGGVQTERFLLSRLTKNTFRGSSRKRALKLLGIRSADKPELKTTLLDLAQEQDIGSLGELRKSDPCKKAWLEEQLNKATELDFALVNELLKHADERHLKTLSGYLTHAEPEQQALAKKAISGIGERLFQCCSGKAYRCLGASQKSEAGEWTLADCLMTRLKNPELPRAQTLRLFEQLSALTHPKLSGFLRRWKKQTDPEVRKWVIQCVGNRYTPGDASWLRELLQSKNDTDVRWALLALASNGVYLIA